MTGKRTAHERFPEVLAAAVRVFTRDGYKAAHMSAVAREAGLSEAALYRYVSGKEALFVLAIRHALLLEDVPAAQFPLKAPSLGEMIAEAREFVADAVPFGSLADALSGPASASASSESAAAELETIMRELYALETATRQAADMIERSARDLPELADLLNEGLRAPVIRALTQYLDRRTRVGVLRATPDTAVAARLVLETLTWFARHRFSDPYGAAIDAQLAEDTAVDALLHALVRRNEVIKAGHHVASPCGVPLSPAGDVGSDLTARGRPAPPDGLAHAPRTPDDSVVRAAVPGAAAGTADERDRGLN